MDSMESKHWLRSAHRGGGPKGSRLPAWAQDLIEALLKDGASISAAARETGYSRDQVRTVKLAMAGTTLAEIRALKRLSKVEPHSCGCPCHRTSDGSLCPCRLPAAVSWVGDDAS